MRVVNLTLSGSLSQGRSLSFLPFLFLSKSPSGSFLSHSSGFFTMLRLLLSAVLFGRALSITQQCVRSDDSTADEFVPCDPTASSGSCCRTEEACLSSGLCYGSIRLLYRGACINSWNSTECLPICDNSTLPLTPGNYLFNLCSFSLASVG